MLLGTLGASLLGNMLAGKGVIRSGERRIRTERYYRNELVLHSLILC